MRHTARALGMIAGVALAGAAYAQPMVVFGDSLSDSGNMFTVRNGSPRPPYAERSSDGPVMVEHLARLLGLEPPVASRRGGTNYAYSGARSGPLTVAASTGIEGTDQLAEFLARNPTADPAALYVLWLPANDLGALARAPNPTQADTDRVVQEGTANVVRMVEALAARGARRFLLVTVPDRGLIPRYTRPGPAESANATAVSESMNAAMVAAIRAVAERQGLELRVFDALRAYREIVANPGQHGFTDARDTCWTGDFSGANGTACAEPARHFFWDPAHPTTAGHRVLAEMAAQVMRASPLVAGR